MFTATFTAYNKSVVKIILMRKQLVYPAEAACNSPTSATFNKNTDSLELNKELFCFRPRFLSCNRSNPKYCDTMIMSSIIFVFQLCDNDDNTHICIFFSMVWRFQAVRELDSADGSGEHSVECKHDIYLKCEVQGGGSSFGVGAVWTVDVLVASSTYCVYVLKLTVHCSTVYQNI
ncbi:hypothetical protein KSF78_0001666 [Schistosoma japonicum]|nr:hypothetical protein KSF78_0001666 [Schistosoma japonicum]